MHKSTITDGLNGIFFDFFIIKLGNLVLIAQVYKINFQTTYPNGTIYAIDLLAFDINTGRDHGLQPYINYIKQCFNVTINTFADLYNLN